MRDKKHGRSSIGASPASPSGGSLNAVTATPALPSTKNDAAAAVSALLPKAREASYSALDIQRQIGRLLNHAKANLVPHGEFNQWAREEFGIEHTWRADLMKLDRLWDEFVSAQEYFESKGRNLNAGDFSTTGALRLIKEADADRKGAPAPKAPRRSKAQDQIEMLQHDIERLEAKVKEAEEARAQAVWLEAEKADQRDEAKRPASDKDAELDRTRKELERTQQELREKQEELREKQEQIAVLTVLARPKTDTSLEALLRRIQISGPTGISPWVPPDASGSFRPPREPKTGFKRHLVPPNVLMHLKGSHLKSPLRRLNGVQP